MSQAASEAAPFNLRERAGWRAERRPEPGFAHALGAGAAAFVVFAVGALVAEIGGDDPQAAGILLYLALAVVAFAVGLRISGPVRSAAVTAIVLSVPLFWLFVFDGGASSGSVRGIYILTIVSYAVLYAFTWTAGRNVLLGLVLLVAASWILAEVGGIDDSGPLPFSSTLEQQADLDVGGSNGFSFDEPDDNSTETSIVALVIGLAYLFAAFRLDRKRLTGAATPFIVVGSILTIAGAIAWGAEESLLAGGIAAVLSGAAVGYVGGQGADRRASTWFGVLFVVGGFLAICVHVVSGSDAEGGSALGYVGAFAVVAALLGAAAWYAAPRLKEHVDGDVDAPLATGRGTTTST